MAENPQQSDVELGWSSISEPNILLVEEKLGHWICAAWVLEDVGSAGSAPACDGNSRWNPEDIQFHTRLQNIPAQGKGHLIVNNHNVPISIGKSQGLQNLAEELIFDYAKVYVNLVDNDGFSTFNKFLETPQGTTGERLWSADLNRSDLLNRNSYIDIQPKDYEEMFGSGGYKNITQDRLYGSRVQVWYEFYESGGRKVGSANDHHYLYRWVNAHDPEPNLPAYNQSVLFERTLADGTDGFIREKTVNVYAPPNLTTVFESYTNSDTFSYGSPVRVKSGQDLFSTSWTFDPQNSGNFTDRIVLKTHVGGDTYLSFDGMDSLFVNGKATPPTIIDLNLNKFKNEMRRILSMVRWTENGRWEYPYGLPFDSLSIGSGFLDTYGDVLFGISNEAWGSMGMGGQPNIFYNSRLNEGLREEFVQSLAEEVYREVIKDFALVNNNVTAIQFSRNGGGDFQVKWGEVLSGSATVYGASGYTYGELGTLVSPIDIDRSIESILRSTSTSHKAKSWALANALNQYKSANIKVNLAQHLDWSQASRDANTTFAQFITNTISHEIAHTFGINEGYVDPDFLTTLPNITPYSTFVEQTGIAWDASALPFDLMMQGFPSTSNLSFSTTNINLLKSSLGIHQESALLQPILINHPTQNVSVTLSPLQVYGLGFNFHNDSLGIRV